MTAQNYPLQILSPWHIILGQIFPGTLMVQVLATYKVMMVIAPQVFLLLTMASLLSFHGLHKEKRSCNLHEVVGPRNISILNPRSVYSVFTKNKTRGEKWWQTWAIQIGW